MMPIFQAANLVLYAESVAMHITPKMGALPFTQIGLRELNCQRKAYRARSSFGCLQVLIGRDFNKSL